jgi:hypothetical protein
MIENGTMGPIETIPRMGGGEIKENDGGGEFNHGIGTLLNVTTYHACVIDLRHGWEHIVSLDGNDCVPPKLQRTDTVG